MDTLKRILAAAGAGYPVGKDITDADVRALAKAVGGDPDEASAIYAAAVEAAMSGMPAKPTSGGGF